MSAADDTSADLTKSFRAQAFGSIKPARLSVGLSDNSADVTLVKGGKQVGNIFSNSKKASAKAADDPFNATGGKFKQESKSLLAMRLENSRSESESEEQRETPRMWEDAANRSSKKGSRGMRSKKQSKQGEEEEVKGATRKDGVDASLSDMSHIREQLVTMEGFTSNADRDKASVHLKPPATPSSKHKAEIETEGSSKKGKRAGNSNSKQDQQQRSSRKKGQSSAAESDDEEEDKSEGENSADDRSPDQERIQKKPPIAAMMSISAYSGLPAASAMDLP